ncbi:hypothetical protein J5N97_027867 [Dioscorea zingiberensis]|uniref:Exonuclease 1 n=1 Tax=Dioscorea zingiberensis TaxID=325984 RepID=A0A9D5H456_9LILI|nr:hypothetical protein J5N97_027867 [Dioscorea zingiberensis]
MGIQNLLRFMKPLIEPIHIEKYSGKRVTPMLSSFVSLFIAVDCSSLFDRLGSMRIHGFTKEHGALPRRREDNLALAKEKLKQGNVSSAIEFFQKAVRITPMMAHELIQILRKENVEFVVAPYEADAQLAYLSNLDADKGGIDAVITEDSDLIAYGCQAVIFKMDRYGKGEELLLDRVFNSVSGELSFKIFDKELFTGMCVLAGCDFLPSISGIGTKRAYSLVSKYRNLDRVLSALRLDKRYQIPEDYSESFRKAVAVFHHATIYDAETKRLKHMKPLEQKDMQCLHEDVDFLGPELPPSMAAAIAEGHLNPLTMEAFDFFSKAESQSDTISIQAFDFLDHNESRMTSAVDNCITIFPAKRISYEDISCRDVSKVALTQESCITIISNQEVSNEEITVTRQVKVDQKKYMKEALALGKLIAPLESHQQVEPDMKRSETPNNNPFKRRKLDNSNPAESRVSVFLEAEKSVDVLCSSSPESQETVESKPIIKAPEAKVKHPKHTKTKIDHKSSILRFFQPL